MNRIKELRKRNNIKQIELCKQLGISQATLSGWENEKFEPDLKSIKKMSNIFSVSIDYLLGTTDYPLDGKEKATPELEQQKTNTIKIIGRDGSCVERELTDDQIDLMKKMIEQMPDANDL